MHFQVKNTKKNNRNYTSTKYFIHFFFAINKLQSQFLPNIYLIQLTITNYIFFKFFFLNHNHKTYPKNKYESRGVAQATP